jgi:hypothetical protein
MDSSTHAEKGVAGGEEMKEQGEREGAAMRLVQQKPILVASS